MSEYNLDIPFKFQYYAHYLDNDGRMNIKWKLLLNHFFPFLLLNFSFSFRFISSWSSCMHFCCVCSRLVKLPRRYKTTAEKNGWFHNENFYVEMRGILLVLDQTLFYRVEPLVMLMWVFILYAGGNVTMMMVNIKQLRMYIPSNESKNILTQNTEQNR